MDALQYVRWFRGASPYINAHRGRTFVLMLGGEAIADANFGNIVHDVALLRSLGVRLVIVFGARPQIDAALAERGLAPRYHDRLRITDPDAAHLTRRVVGELRMQIEALLSMGLPGTPMHASRIAVTGGNFVVARPLGVVDGVDYQFTGEVRRIDASGLRAQLDAGCIPLLGPCGYSPAGEVFNLAYEEVAARVAASLAADKLIALDDEPGLRDANGALLAELTPQELEDWMAAQDDDSEAGSERLRQASALLWAVRSGVRRGHVVSHADDGALLVELFTRAGGGTQITEHSAERERPATLDDVAGIIELTAPLEAKGLLLPRSRERIELDIDHFRIIELDGMVIACAALYRYPEENAGEIACVVTHPEHQGGDRAERLVARLERSASEAGIDRVFALSTRAAAWFVEQGYRETGPAELPAARARQWSAERGSKVLVKDLRRV
ncbi:MAG: amino-acid N-acetyltransferase [Pseudomonadales bacterium]|nr:amino-acid N-acetyltransferase [Pseudomonadales bacterium]